GELHRFIAFISLSKRGLKQKLGGLPASKPVHHCIYLPVEEGTETKIACTDLERPIIIAFISLSKRGLKQFTTIPAKHFSNIAFISLSKRGLKRERSINLPKPFWIDCIY